MDNVAVIKLLFAVLVCLVAAPHTESSMNNCSLVYQNLAPCIEFLKNGQDQPTAACCNGVKTLNSLATTTLLNKRAASECMKKSALAAAFPGINPNNSASLPIKCRGVDLPSQSVRLLTNNSQNQPRPAIWNYVFSLYYGVNFCTVNHCTGAKLTVENFTIHGLWPNSQDSPSQPPKSPVQSALINCDPSSHVPSSITVIQDALASAWPNILHNQQGQDYFFWDHEWIKHGTCSTFPVISYFSWALTLFSKLNPTKTLLTKYPPHNVDKYKVNDLHNLYPNKRPYVYCNNLDPTSPLLLEIQFCLDNQAHQDTVDCSVFYTKKDLTNCQGGVFKFLKAWIHSYSTI